MYDQSVNDHQFPTTIKDYQLIDQGWALMCVFT